MKTKLAKTEATNFKTNEDELTFSAEKAEVVVYVARPAAFALSITPSVRN